MNLSALALFAFVSTITPGPNNLMLWASGMNFGLRRTLRPLLGVILGFASLVAATGMGLGALFQTLPWLSPLLRIVGSLYLVYLAYRIATAGRSEDASKGRPFTFTEAVAFQYVNPKAWVMAITATGSFLPPDQSVLLGTAVITGTFMLIGFPSITTWAAARTAIGRILTNNRRRLAVNTGFGLLLLYTVYLINA